MSKRNKVLTAICSMKRAKARRHTGPHAWRLCRDFPPVLPREIVNRGPRTDKIVNERNARRSLARRSVKAPGAWIETQIGMPGSHFCHRQALANAVKRNLESASGAYLMQSMLRVMFAALVAVAGRPSPNRRDGAAGGEADQAHGEANPGLYRRPEEMQPIMEKIQGATSDQLDPKLQAALEGRRQEETASRTWPTTTRSLAKHFDGDGRHRSAQTKVFTEPQVAIKKEIAEVTADKSISEQEKKQVLEELNEAMKWAQPIQFPSNIELVKKYSTSFGWAHQAAEWVVRMRFADPSSRQPASILS